MKTMDNREYDSIKSSRDIYNDAHSERVKNKHRHSASVKNLNTLNMGASASEQTFESIRDRPKSSATAGRHMSKKDKL